MGSIFKNGNQSFRRSGFTIVELLIVIAIIGVLASISFAAYSGLKERAEVSAVSMSLNQAAKKVDLYHIENSTYPSSLSNVGINDGEVVYQYNVTSTAYCITGTQGSTSFYVSESVSQPTKGGCAGHGQGGVAAVTNLITNPSMELSDAGGLYRWFGSSPGAGTNERVAGIGLNGGYGIRKTWSVAPSSSADAGFQWSFAAPDVGQSYTCSAYATASVTQRMHARIEFFNSAGTRFSNAFGTDTTVPANTLTRMSATGTVPASTVRLQCVVEVATGGSYVNFAPGNRMWADAAMLTTGPTLSDYFDGSYTNWVWNGTPHASSSTGPAL